MAWYGVLAWLFIMSPRAATIWLLVNMFVATGSGVSLVRMMSGCTALFRPVFFLSSHVMSSLYLGDTGCCESMFMPDG